MKLMMKLLVLFFGVLMLANVANAETPREQLKQMVEQLQKSPTDNALREQIIKLAQQLKPAPAVPEDAEQFEGRAQFAFSHAKSPADYLDAAKEYEKAIAAAPWVAGYYADLCTIYEKAEKYAEAKKSCEFFLVSSPSVQDASDVRKRIAGLGFAMEKANSHVAATEKAQSMEGFWQINSERYKQNNGNWNQWVSKEDDQTRDVIRLRKHNGDSYEINHLSVPWWSPQDVLIDTDGHTDLMGSELNCFLVKLRMFGLAQIEKTKHGKGGI